MIQSNVMTKSRSSNYEFLRIVAMIMIVSLHYFFVGTVLEHAELGTFTYFFAWFVESLCYVAVNCYMLITGYFLVNSTFKLKKLLLLWLQVVFITVGSYSISCIAGINIFSIKEFVCTFLPITMTRYWYITAYFLLYLLSPFLNKVIKMMNQTQHKKLILVLLLIFCVGANIFFRNDFTAIQGGYSLVWFVVLYFIASYIRIYGLKLFDQKSRYMMLYIGFSILLFLSRYVPSVLTLKLFGAVKGSNIFYSYNSILVFLASICLFMFFKDVHIKNVKTNKVILFLSSVTLDVYLIHLNPSITSWLWKSVINPLQHLNSWKFIPHFIVSVLLVYLACSAIGYVRQKLFQILHIPQIAEKISSKIERVGRKIWNSKTMKKL